MGLTGGEMSHAGLFDRSTAHRSASSRDSPTITTSRRLSAILAADVAGYSRLMGADEERTLERLKAHRRQLVDPKIKQHHGRIVKTTGDGMLVEFPSVVDAVRALSRCSGRCSTAMPTLPRISGSPSASGSISGT
jgi:class 3 adenylate cyclase